MNGRLPYRSASVPAIGETTPAVRRVGAVRPASQSSGST
jgi:hypothetical protein